jgi:D-glycero-D-manno-heptose 1,7-bisphosphate phosphatase
VDEKRSRYVLLEREGVISLRNAGGDARCRPQFEFLPRALDALRLLAAEDYAGIIVSRQSWACKGLGSSSELDVITRRLLLEVALSDGHIAGVYYCRHKDEDACNCYAPSGGLIARAKAEHGFTLEDTYFVGEKELGLGAAIAAGCPSIRIQRDAFLQAETGGKEAGGVASSLYEAVEQILALGRFRKSMYTAVLA